MLQGADEITRADEYTDAPHPTPRQSPAPSSSPVSGTPEWPATEPSSPPPSSSDRCAPLAGTSRIRAYRLALGVSLADVVAQIRAWYASEGRPAPRFSETLLSAYESGQKSPGPEYLH